MSTATAEQTRVCNREDCPNAGVPLPLSEFQTYSRLLVKEGRVERHRTECKLCSREDKRQARLARPERPAAVAEPELPSHRSLLLDAVINPPAPEQEQLTSRERALMCELSTLKQQLTWASHANPRERQGGTVTINHSDDHYGDRAHMLDCQAELEAKTLTLLEMYQPERIVMLSNGDKVAGRGVYKEQHMDSVLPMTTQQLDLAAYKVIRMDQRIKEKFPQATVEWKFTHGNHDVNMGERLTPRLIYQIRGFGVTAKYYGDEALINLADRGDYWALFEHGTGYSDISPSAPKWWSNMRDKLLRLGRTHYASRRVRRVSHGHTHYFSLSLERIQDLFVDTTGGCQRNERVLLGKNNRPMGWIAYVSPRGYASILDPIGIQPELETVERELLDPYLFNRNMVDASALLQAYHELEIEAGVRPATSISPEGR